MDDINKLLADAMAYGESLSCVCEANKENQKPWVCPRHGMFWKKSLVIEYKDGHKEKLPPVIPRFSSEAEEAAWWDAHRSEIESEIRQRMNQRRVYSDAEGKDDPCRDGDYTGTTPCA